MDWLSENWVFLVVVVGMVAMHLFGHGGHAATAAGAATMKAKAPGTCIDRNT
jgi:uncharacterized membrane protein YtjA (UPF0391 family)